MKKIYIKIKPFNNKIFYNNYLFKVNNGSNVFWKMDKKMKKMGVELNTIDIKGSTNLYIYCDVPYPWCIRLWWDIIKHNNKNILINFESPIINPFSLWKPLWFLFNRVYTWNDDFIDNKKVYKLNIPQISYNRTKHIKYSDKKLLVAVYANKNTPPLFSMFTKYRSLYRVRNELIRKFCIEIPNDFDLYGRGWDNPTLFNLRGKSLNHCKNNCYKGEIVDKIDTISKYKFCLAIENAEAPGYITEKLFDCFKARCVPIYLGDSSIYKYIPKDCFINLKDYSSFPDLLNLLQGMEETTYNKYIGAMETFLRNRINLDNWFEKGFENLLLEYVGKAEIDY